MPKTENRKRRHLKVRKKVTGTKDKLRLVVYRSNKNTFAQIIDDSESKTIVAVSSINTKPLKKEISSSKKIMGAQGVGEKLAVVAKKKNITKVVFDRGGYKYHGRIKALAESVRKGGIKF